MKIRFKAKMCSNVNLLIVIKIVVKDLLVTFEREKPSDSKLLFLKVANEHKNYNIVDKGSQTIVSSNSLLNENEMKIL